MPRVLIAEDETAIADAVLYALRSEGIEADHCLLAREVIPRVRSVGIDVVVLDVGLPDASGFDVCRELRGFSDVPVIFLTARNDEIDRVLGLELGGDDYVIKPFESRELVARVRSILRRRGLAPGEAPGHRRYASFNGWRIDCAANLLRAPDGTEHLLGTAETQVLRCFVERPHQILTREQLMGGRDLLPTDRSIDVRISRLRKKIEADPHEPAVIKTVYGAGYLFAADVHWE